MRTLYTEAISNIFKNLCFPLIGKMELAHKSFEKLRDEDKVVLQLIRDGTDDVRSINKATSLSRRQVGYAFTKMDELGLIDVISEEDEYVREHVNGQERRYRKPREGNLTELGKRYFELRDSPDIDPDELAQKETDNQIEELKEHVQQLADKINFDLEASSHFDRPDIPFENYARRCFVCGESNLPVLQKHHIIPRRYGGGNSNENLVTLCASCHEAIEQIYDDSFYSRLKDNWSVE